MVQVKRALLPRKACGKLVLILALAVSIELRLTSAQLPDDIQRELNQNLAEQARIQAMRLQHQRQIQARAGGASGQLVSGLPATGAAQPAHDPNNYSYQQVSPPIQYSYYQPFGDVAQSGPAQAGSLSSASDKSTPVDNNMNNMNNFDLNNLNFELPQPQAQVAGPQAPGSGVRPGGAGQVQLTPSFTGAGGLPVMMPLAGSAAAPPEAAQARQVQQGPPLTEADFRDITGPENYEAAGSGGSDFGMGELGGGGSSSAGQRPSQHSRLSEFGFPMMGGPAQQPGSSKSQLSRLSPMGADFGVSELMGEPQRSRSASLGQPAGVSGDLGDFDGSSQGQGGSGDFDFASQPSSQQGEQQQASLAGLQGGPPGSLQGLLGAGFPGLGLAPGSGNLDGLSGEAGSGPRSGGDQSLFENENSLDQMSGLADRPDGFSGPDLGQFEQPNEEKPGQDMQDFNLASASEHQPSSVAYPDEALRPVGSLLALTQPQSLTQARYSALPDKGTYQDYPAYQQLDESSFESSVSQVVDATPAARRPGPGRYGWPSPQSLAPEKRHFLISQHYDYTQGPDQL